MLDGSRNSKIAFNFCCICLIWGSTFLAVKYAIETIPPFVVTALRYVMASLVLAMISKMRKETWLTAANLRLAAISGFLLSLGNALVCYSVTSLPTGLVAVVIGSLPAWIILFDWQLFRGKPPQWGQVAGIVLSLIGVGALTSSHSEHLDMRNLLVCAVLVDWGLGDGDAGSASSFGAGFDLPVLVGAVAGRWCDDWSHDDLGWEFGFPLGSDHDFVRVGFAVSHVGWNRGGGDIVCLAQPERGTSSGEYLRVDHSGRCRMAGLVGRG
jgi:hypothetical protein